MSVLPKLLGPFNLQMVEVLVDENVSARALAGKVGCSPAKVTQFIKLFRRNGLIEIIKEKNRKIVALNRHNPLIREIISLLFVYKIIGARAFSELRGKSGSVGLYGSAAEGTVDKKSDIDLWVVSDKKFSLEKAGELRMRISKELGREVSLKFFTEKDVENLRQKDAIFFNELEYKSKILAGEGFGQKQS
ncbi:MAG: nucleotidyltransferase domain-containing protein [Candidatus Diapherotrites archaeon]